MVTEGVGNRHCSGSSTASPAVRPVLTVDWNEQTAKVAESYLDFPGFSRGGLIAQLEFDGFTPSQAAYGATAAGL
ncbi:hypothetical protein A5669_15790 [Mycolicibacterium fortuitum]|nr:hypothetical protein A5669_15790 [Mycolicibacterium fortuitum]